MEKNKELKIKVSAPEETKIVAFVAPKRNFDTDFITVFQDYWERLARDKELTLTDLRVFNGLISYLEFNNEINLTQSQLGKKLDIDRAEISKSLKRLIQKDYLRVIRTVGRKNIYQLNPYLGIKSKGSKHKKMCKDWDETEQED